MSRRNIIKESTVNQLKKLIEEHGVSGMMDTPEYKNMRDRNYLNKLEKENLMTIITLINDGKRYDEIRFIIEGGEELHHNKYKEDPVEKATEDFMVSMSKVILSEPPEIIIAGVDDVEEEILEEVEDVVVEETVTNVNTVQEESETDNVILLKDIVSNKNKDIERADDESVNDNGEKSLSTSNTSKYTKRKKKMAELTLPDFSKHIEELRKCQ